MDALQQALAPILQDTPTKVTLSAPRQKGAGPLRATLAPLAGDGWQLEEFTATQAFHKNIAPAALAETVQGLLLGHYTQLTAFGKTHQHSLRITKKGRVLATKKAGAPQPKPAGPGRQKQYLLAEGTAVPPLVDMGIFTPEGQVKKPMYDKFRQINRFTEQIDDALKGWQKPTIHVVDFGCGKSYLTFVLYHYLTNIRGLAAHVTGLDLKSDVVQNCNKAARRYGYHNLHFVVGDISGYTQNTPADMVVTLHACDTATDYALAAAVNWGAKYIFSVPCCQHQLNAQIHSDALAILTRYGIVKERAAALMTDAVRANLLSVCGYKTQLLEFVDFAHTPKNILIRAVKTGQPLQKRAQALAEVQRLMAAFALQPKLYALLCTAPAFEAAQNALESTNSK